MKTTKRGFGSSRIVSMAFLGSMAVAALASASAAVATTTTAATTNNDNFPRIGLLSTAGPQKYASSFQTYAAKFQVVIIGGNYEGWERGAGYSKEKVIQSIKSQSTVETRVFQYVALNEALYNTTYASLNPLAGWYNQVVARNWWLHPTTTAGTPVVDPQSTQKWLVNMGPNVPVDPATALGPYAWGAKYVDDLFHLGRHGRYFWRPPSLDGFFLDNILIDPSNGAGNWLLATG